MFIRGLMIVFVAVVVVLLYVGAYRPDVIDMFNAHQ